MRIWDALQQWLCTPSDPSLMNARWQHLIILDPRMRLHTLSFVRTAAYSSHHLSYCLSQRKAEAGPSRAWNSLQLRSKRNQHSRWGRPFSSIICNERFRLTANSTLAQIFFVRSLSGN